MVKRYDIELYDGQPGQTLAKMIECDHGPCVMFYDYAALDAALDECIANCADPRDKRRVRELEADNARHKSAVLALLGRVRKLEVALEVIASGTICPDLFPDAVRTEQDYELAAKTAMVTAIAALERGAEHE